MLMQGIRTCVICFCSFFYKPSFCRIVKPQHDMLYTWADPAGPRVIYFEDNGKHIENDLRRDGLNKFK